MRNIIIFSAIFVFGLALSACAAPPTEEMSKAQDAVIMAESDADAVAYAGNTLIRARDALTRMQSEADAKRYDAAKNFAAEAVTYAEKAVADGKTGAARAMDEAANLISGLSGPLAETSSAIDTAKKVQDIQLDFDSISQEMNLAQQTYDDALQSFQTDDYKDVIDKGQTVRSMLSDINSELSQAAMTTSRKQ